jgi:hypothetical protein
MKVSPGLLVAAALLLRSDPALPAAGASVTVNSMSCHVHTQAGLAPVAPTGFECGASLFGGFGSASFADGLQIRATVTLHVFDEGLFGAEAGMFSPLPSNPLVSGFVPAGFEWAGASVLVGMRQDPRFANPHLAPTFSAATLRTTQDAIPEDLTRTVELEGSASLDFDPGELVIGQFATVGVYPVTWWESGVAPIPEPPVYAFLLAGLGMLGFALWRPGATTL